MNHNVLFNRQTIRGWELRQGCESFAHATCSALGLKPVTVSWNLGIRTAAINIYGDIILAAVKDDAVITRKTLMRYAGFIVHELLHRKYTRNGSGTINAGQYLLALHNAVEDAWIEHNAIDSGLLGNVEGLLTELLEQMITEAEAEVSDWSDPAQYPFLLAVWCRRHARNIPLPAGLQPIFDQAAQRVLACQSTDDTFAVAEWVEKQLRLNLPKQGQKQRQQQDQKQGQKQDKKQGQKQGQNTPQNPSDQPQSADQGQGKGKGAGQDKNGAKAPAADCTPVEVEPTLKAPSGTESCGTFNKSAEVRPSRTQAGGHPSWSAGSVPAKLRYEVRKLFESTAQTDFSPNRKTGAVNTRALHKLGVSDALFQMRRDKDGIDSAVVLVIDTSSSMGADGYAKMSAAAASAHALLETLTSAGVSTAVVSFDDRIYIDAPFDARLQFKRDIVLRLGPYGGTNDYAAIKVAHDLLRQRPEARKVCFVLSDGDGDRQAAKEQADSGDAFGITTIGIGICHDVSRVYKNNVRVDVPADLGKVAFNQIKLAV